MKSVIFDFNGTLFWDSQLHIDTRREYSKKLREVPFSDEEMLKYMFGHTNEDIVEYAIGKKPDKALVDRVASEKRNRRSCNRYFRSRTSSCRSSALQTG